MTLQGVNIWIGTQTRSGSTMINTPSPWRAKINAQQLFRFVVLLVRRTSIDLAASMKARLELYKYEGCSPKNHERTRQEEMGFTGYNIKLQKLLLRRDVIMKNKNKLELSVLVSSCSLEECTAVESQSDSLYLTSWGRHHNTVLGYKSCIRGTQCHQGALWRHGFLSACSSTGCT